MTDAALKLSLDWSDGDGHSRRLTTASFHASIGDFVIWPVPGEPNISVEIQADDLLSHLTEFWKPLVLRQTYPIPIQPDRPSLLRVEAEKRWANAPLEAVEREQALVTAFEEAHDLSQSFAGQFGLPSLWLVREGDHMLVETRAGLRAVGFDSALQSLTTVGDEIAERLEKSGSGRWSLLVKAWHDRDKGKPEILLAWSASLEPNLAQAFIKERILRAPKDVKEAANDNDELRIAARMASALPPEQIRQVVELVKGFKQQSAPKLDELTAHTATYVKQQFANHRPYEQGEAAANFLRAHLSLASVQYIDIFTLVESLGVSLHARTVEPRTLLALAVWGSSHGPAVLLNESSLHLRRDIRRNHFARVTLAHELCHLLLDRAHALSAVEVLHSRMPANVEQRAKAFAGEFLLPGRVAAEIWSREKAPRSTAGLDAVLNILCSRYGVTRNVAAWKLEHGLHRLDVDLRVLLDAVAPNR